MSAPRLTLGERLALGAALVVIVIIAGVQYAWHPFAVYGVAMLAVVAVLIIGGWIGDEAAPIAETRATRLYVASSWRNTKQQAIVAALRLDGHEVYDFMHPPGGDHLGFSWSDVDPEWRSWDSASYLAGLLDPTAQAGFDSDYSAMQRADACVLVLPCGRSAHLEAGYFVGAGKPLYILLDEDEFPPSILAANPELMYKMATLVARDMTPIRSTLAPHLIPRSDTEGYMTLDALTKRLRPMTSGELADLMSRAHPKVPLDTVPEMADDPGIGSPQ